MPISKPRPAEKEDEEFSRLESGGKLVNQLEFDTQLAGALSLIMRKT